MYCILNQFCPRNLFSRYRICYQAHHSTEQQQSFGLCLVHRFKIWFSFFPRFFFIFYRNEVDRGHNKIRPNNFLFGKEVQREWKKWIVKYSDMLKTKKTKSNERKRGKKESYAWIDAPFQYVFLLWNYIFSMRFRWIEVVIVDRFFVYFPWQFFEAKLVPYFQMNDDNSQHEQFVENFGFSDTEERKIRELVELCRIIIIENRRMFSVQRSWR